MTSLSVVMSVYNEAERLAPSLTALAGQAVPGDEIVVVDDGSTDATRSIAEAIAAQFQAVKVYANSSNIGVIATISAMLPKLGGDYVGLFAADEIAAPELFNTIRRTADCWPQAGVVATAATISVAGPASAHLVYDFDMPSTAGYLEGADLASVCRHKYFWLAPPASFMRRSTIEAGIGWRIELDWLADWVQVYDLALRFGVAYVSAPLVEIQERADSFGAMRRQDPSSRGSAIRAFLQILRTAKGRTMRHALRTGGLLLPYALSEKVFRDLFMQPRDWDLLISAAAAYIPHRIRATLKARLGGERPFGSRPARN